MRQDARAIPAEVPTEWWRDGKSFGAEELARLLLDFGVTRADAANLFALIDEDGRTTWARLSHAVQHADGFDALVELVRRRRIGGGLRMFGKFPNRPVSWVVS